MMFGRILGWLALLVTGVSLAAWLMVTTWMVGGPVVGAVRTALPESTWLAELEERLPRSPVLAALTDADADPGTDPGSAPEATADSAPGPSQDLGATESASDGAGRGDPASDATAPSAPDRPAGPATMRPTESPAASPTDRAPETPAGANPPAGEADDAQEGDPDAGVVPPPQGRDPEVGRDGSDLTPAVNWPDFESYEALFEGTPDIQTPSFDVYAAGDDDPMLQAAVRRWAPELEDLRAYVESRTGTELPRTPVTVVFDRRYDARCPARGLASPGGETPLLAVFVDESVPDVQVRAVLAHEIAHHLFYTEEFVGDGVLTEGLANWAAGEYALAWQGFERWSEAARRYLAGGTYISVADQTALTPRAGDDCIVRRDRAYNVRAAFVDWMVERYGLELLRAMPPDTVQRFDALSGETVEMTIPDYVAATGHSLTQLERIWLRELTTEATEPTDDATTGDAP